MRLSVACACLLALSACARSAIESPDPDGGVSGSRDGGDMDDGADAGGGGDAGAEGGADAGKDAGPGPGPGGEDAGDDAGRDAGISCAAEAACAAASDLGKLDGTDSAATLTKQGSGSAFVRVAVSDGNQGGWGNGLGGIKAAITVPSGSDYDVFILGDLSKTGDACTANGTKSDSADQRTAVWNAEGPVSPVVDRALTVEVRHLSGPCDKPWTLTVTGAPCSAARLPSTAPSCD